MLSLDNQTNEIRKRRRKIFEGTASNSIEPSNVRRNSNVGDFVNNSQVLGPLGKKMLKHSHDRKRSSTSDIPVESNVIFTKKHFSRSIVSLRSSNGSQSIVPFMPLSLSMSNSNDNLMSLSDENNMKLESLPDIDHHKCLIEVNFLYDEGLLHHKYCEYVHRQPFA